MRLLSARSVARRWLALHGALKLRSTAFQSLLKGLVVLMAEVCAVLVQGVF